MNKPKLVINYYYLAVALTIALGALKAFDIVTFDVFYCTTPLWAPVMLAIFVIGLRLLWFLCKRVLQAL